MSDETKEPGEQSPFTKPGFIASAVLLFIVLLMAGYLVWSNTRDEGEPVSQEPQQEEAGESPNTEDGEEPESAEGDSVCGLSGIAEDGASLTRAPEADGWEYENIVPYPVSAEYGPAAEDDSGYRYCFQQTPEGALFFTANAVEQGSVGNSAEWIEYAVSEGSQRDELVQEGATATGEGNDVRLDVVGFRIMSFSPDEAIVQLALDGQGQGETVQLSAEVSLVWEDGDWKYDGNSEEPISLVPVGGHGSQIVRWSQGD